MNEIDETDITKLQHDNYLVRVISNHIRLMNIEIIPSFY